MKPAISRKLHGLVGDYPFVTAAATAPYLFKFKDDKKAVTLTRILASTALLSALSTKAEWSPMKVVPYKGHIMADVALGAFAIAAPWLFGFNSNKRARNTILGLAATGLAVTILSILSGDLDSQDTTGNKQHLTM